MSDSKDTNYELQTDAIREIPAPDLNYGPPVPHNYRPRIALVGCGGISEKHLEAYARQEYPVVALCDVQRERAESRRDLYCPGARIYTDYRQMLEKESDVEVVDAALHPAHRGAVIRAALEAGRHVLSQKPFVLDLNEGQALVDMAEERGLKLAVNQNGRWAPYVRYAAAILASGHLGDLQSVAITLRWDHRWTKGTPFEKVYHLMFFDFGIHWFDMATLFFKERKPQRVMAAVNRAPGQDMEPPLLAHASAIYPEGQASFVFDGATGFGPGEFLLLTGTRGTLEAQGPVCKAHQLRIFTEAGVASPRLTGDWFTEGFAGAMGELLCAVEQKREPENSARRNLDSLRLCFAAIRSADTGNPQDPASVRSP